MITLADMVQKADYLVEADGFSHQALWEKFSVDSIYKGEFNIINWHDAPDGIVHQVGAIKKRPINAELRMEQLNSHFVVFYSACSELVDWAMIEVWLDKTFPGKERFNAMNFQHVFHKIRG